MWVGVQQGGGGGNITTSAVLAVGEIAKLRRGFASNCASIVPASVSCVRIHAAFGFLTTCCGAVLVLAVFVALIGCNGGHWG